MFRRDNSSEVMGSRLVTCISSLLINRFARVVGSSHDAVAIPQDLKFGHLHGLAHKKFPRHATDSFNLENASEESLALPLDSCTGIDPSKFGKRNVPL